MSSFYVTGGTLRQDAACYVERQADKDLLDGLLKGEFCYVLTSRQMGKSSLMVRTAQRLRGSGARVAILDLTAIGQNLTVEQWYDGLMSKLGQQLDLEDELLDFWRANGAWGPLQRWMTALEKVVLPRCQGNLVIFVDEIDLVRSLPFSTDEFFAAIRECYNRRSRDTIFARLSFCLLGVASPSDLIRNVRMTPFNIGRRIELDDFTAPEAAPLAKGLARNDEIGQRLLSRVLYWTHGHPYLTQRLCRAIAEDGSGTSPADVDGHCEELFLSSKARECDDNLLFVRERMLKSDVGLAELLGLYAQMLKGKPVPDIEANPLVTVLRLSGVARGERGMMRVRNNVYARVFDAAWVRTNMPEAEVRRQRAAFRRGAVGAAALGVVLLAMLVFWAVYQSPNQPIEQRMKDGSVLRLEKISYGARHSFERGPFRTAWLRGLLPFLPFKSSFAISSSSSQDSLVLWLSRRDPQTGAELDCDWLATATAEDEHGCRFWPGVCGFGSGSSMTSSGQRFPSFTRPIGAKDLIIACEFPSFPRRQKTFKVVFYDQNSQPAIALSIPNPAAKTYPQWAPNPLPVSHQEGPLKFSLVAFSNRMETAQAAGIISEWVLPEATFAFTRNGQTTKDWAAIGTTFSDATDNRWGGNFYSSGGICLQESAWKVRAEFFRTPEAQFLPHEIWTVENILLPPDGIAKALALSTNLGSKRLDLHFIAGPGQYAYSNATLISSQPNSAQNQSYGRSSSGNGFNMETKIATRLPHLFLSMQDLTPEVMAAFRAVDDQGHRTSGFLGIYANRYQCLELPLSSNATKVTLSFMVYTGLVAEFVVSPPAAAKPTVRALSAADNTALARSIPPRDTRADSNMVDLAAFYTAPLRGERRLTGISVSGPVPNGSSSGSYDLQRLPAGLQRIGGVDFDMRGVVQLNGLAVRLEQRRNRSFEFPGQVENINLSQTCRCLHLLHGCLWSAMDGTTIGRYVFHYADGQTAELPVIYGRDVRNLSPLAGELTPPVSPDPAWTDNSGSTRYQLFKFMWMNPRPAVEIKSMDFISAQTLSAPFLIAITGEP